MDIYWILMDVYNILLDFYGILMFIIIDLWIFIGYFVGFVEMLSYIIDKFF